MQLLLNDPKHIGKRKRALSEVFLVQSDRVIPWAELLGAEPRSPKAGRRGRRRTLRTKCCGSTSCSSGMQ